MIRPQIFWYKLDKKKNKTFSKIHDVYSVEDLVTCCGIKIPILPGTYVVNHLDDDFNIHPHPYGPHSECFRCSDSI